MPMRHPTPDYNKFLSNNCESTSAVMVLEPSSAVAGLPQAKRQRLICAAQVIRLAKVFHFMALSAIIIATKTKRMLFKQVKVRPQVMWSTNLVPK